jgi:hypothetical protein
MSNQLYSVEAMICGTVYVRASSKAEAERFARHFIKGQTFEFDGCDISGAQFDNPELPSISLSPVFTGISLSGSASEVD